MSSLNKPDPIKQISHLWWKVGETVQCPMTIWRWKTTKRGFVNFREIQIFEDWVSAHTFKTDLGFSGTLYEVHDHANLPRTWLHDSVFCIGVVLSGPSTGIFCKDLEEPLSLKSIYPFCSPSRNVMLDYAINLAKWQIQQYKYDNVPISGL